MQRPSENCNTLRAWPRYRAARQRRSFSDRPGRHEGKRLKYAARRVLRCAALCRAIVGSRSMLPPEPVTLRPAGAANSQCLLPSGVRPGGVIISLGGARQIVRIGPSMNDLESHQRDADAATHDAFGGRISIICLHDSSRDAVRMQLQSSADPVMTVSAGSRDKRFQCTSAAPRRKRDASIVIQIAARRFANQTR